MEKIDEQLNNLRMSEVPIGIHQFVMHKVNYRRIRPALFSAFILLTVNFVIMALHIDTKLVEAEFSAMMTDLFGTFDMSFYFMNTIIGSFFEIIPPVIVFSFLLNLIGTIYIGNKIRKSEFKTHIETNPLPIAY